MNLYPNSGKKLKKVVKVVNFLGYLFSSLAGIGIGLGVGSLLFSTGLNGWLCSVISILVGTLASVPLIMVVWVRGLVMWNISDASEHSQALCQKLDA